jgi:D-alanine-D-alanine ligase
MRTKDLKPNIALLYGGYSREAEISAQSAANVYEWIDKKRYNVFMVQLQRTSWQCHSGSQPPIDVDKNDFSVTIDGAKVRFDLAMIMIHGSPGEDGLLQGYLDMLGIPYTSCSAFVSALTFDKFACKNYLRGANIPMAHDVIATLREDAPDKFADQIIKILGMPLFVKPNADGSSFGVSKVKTREELCIAMDNLKENGVEEILVEQYVAGTEVSVGAMLLGDQIFVLPITEIVSKNEFFDYEAKYTSGRSQEITPARLHVDVANKIEDLTLLIYKRLNCSGIVRIDYIVRNNEPYFLEINTVPGMSSASIVPQQIAAMGRTMEQTMTDLIETSLPLNACKKRPQ